MQKLRRRFSTPVNNPADASRGRSGSTNSYFEEFFGRHSTGTSLPTGLRRAVTVRPNEPILSSIFSQGKSRRNFELEQRALLDQIAALQSTMRGLADMLRDQDHQLESVSSHNTKLTEELNHLAEENIELRREIDEQRRLKSAAWEELQIYKMAARTRRDKLIIQQRAIAQLSKQKDDLAKFSQELLEQLTIERKKSKQRRATLKFLASEMDDRRFSTISVDFDDLEQETDDMMAQFHQTLSAAPVELTPDLKSCEESKPQIESKPEPHKNGYLGRPNIDVEIESPRRRNRQQTNESNTLPQRPNQFFPKESSPEPSSVLTAAAAASKERNDAVKRAQQLAKETEVAYVPSSNLLSPDGSITEEDFLSSSDDDDEFAFFDSPSTPISLLLSSIENKFGASSSKDSATNKPSESNDTQNKRRRSIETKETFSKSEVVVKVSTVGSAPLGMDSPALDDEFDPQLDIMTPYENPFDSLKNVTPSQSPDKNKKFFEESEPETLEIDEDMLFLEESFNEDDAPDLLCRKDSPSKSRSQSRSTRTASNSLVPKKRSSLSHSYSHSHSAIDELWSSDDSD